MSECPRNGKSVGVLYCQIPFVRAIQKLSLLENIQCQSSECYILLDPDCHIS